MTEDEIKREMARQDMEIFKQDATERLKGQIDLAKLIIQSLILTNGGAIVALFTLVAKKANGFTPAADQLWAAFAWFVAGLVAALLTGFGGFMSQFYFHIASSRQTWSEQAKALGTTYDKDHMPYFTAGNWILYVSIAAAAASVVFFGIGAWAALSGSLSGSAPN